MLPKGGKDQISNIAGQHRLRAELNDAWAFGLDQCQQPREVEVVGEDDVSFPSRPPQDFLIRRS